MKNSQFFYFICLVEFCCHWHRVAAHLLPLLISLSRFQVGHLYHIPAPQSAGMLYDFIILMRFIFTKISISQQRSNIFQKFFFVSDSRSGKLSNGVSTYLSTSTVPEILLKTNEVFLRIFIKIMFMIKYPIKTLISLFFT